MSDITLVIRIPEEEYKQCKNYKGHLGDHRMISDAIANGTPLPKGYGDLINRDEIECIRALHDFKWGKITAKECAAKIKYSAPAIIKEDKDLDLEDKDLDLIESDFVFDIQKAYDAGVGCLYFGGEIIEDEIFSGKDIFEGDYSTPLLQGRPEIINMDKFTVDTGDKYYFLEFENGASLLLTEEEMLAGLERNKEQEKEIEEIERD